MKRQVSGKSMNEFDETSLFIRTLYLQRDGNIGKNLLLKFWNPVKNIFKTYFKYLKPNINYSKKLNVFQIFKT